MWKSLVRSTNVYSNFRCTVVSTFDWSWSEFVTYIVSDPSCENIHVRSRFFWQTMGLTSGQHCTTLWHKTERNTFALMQQTNTEMGTQWKHILEGAFYISFAKEGFQSCCSKCRVIRAIIHKLIRHARVFLKDDMVSGLLFLFRLNQKQECCKKERKVWLKGKNQRQAIIKGVLLGQWPLCLEDRAVLW